MASTSECSKLNCLVCRYCHDHAEILDKAVLLFNQLLSCMLVMPKSESYQMMEQNPEAQRRIKQRTKSVLTSCCKVRGPEQLFKAFDFSFKSNNPPT